MGTIYKVVDSVRKFIKDHGQLILWLIFVIFIFVSLGMLFTHDVGYALVVFIPSIIFLCPPVVKFIQRKTRLKKVVLGVLSFVVMFLALFTTNQLSAAEKEEQQRLAQEKREEREKKLEEEKAQQEEAKKQEEERKKQEEEQMAKSKKTLEKTAKTAQKEQKEKATAATKNKKVIVRASKKSGQYYTPDHPSYNSIAAQNLIVFNSEEAAIKAGYKKAS